MEFPQLAFGPGGVAAEFCGEEAGDGGRGGERGAGIEEEGAGAPGEDIFDGARHFASSGPGHLGAGDV